ncbi:hypothetical protein J6590_059346, partial [Homalodisca vitripennis]
ATVNGTWIIIHFAKLVLVAQLADETTPMICKLINLDLDPSLVESPEGVLVQ